MIRFVLLQNRQGKTRLSKWYTPPKTANGTTTDAEKARIEAEIHRLVTARDKKYTNFSTFSFPAIAIAVVCGRSGTGIGRGTLPRNGNTHRISFGICSPNHRSRVRFVQDCLSTIRRSLLFDWCEC
jgi:hypothetical protein